MPYSAGTLLAAEEEGVEEAFWAGLRALEEQEALLRRMLDRPWATDSTFQRRLRDRARTSHRRADTLRKFLLSASAPTVASDDGPDLVDEGHTAMTGLTG